MADTHVVLPLLDVLLPLLGVGRLNGELLGEDVTQLRTVTVSTTSNLLFVIIVVGRGEEVAENKLRDVYLLLLVDLDGDTPTVVLDLDEVLLWGNCHFDLLHAGVADLVVGGVDENFIKNLEQAGHNLDMFFHQTLGRLVINPLLLLVDLDRADVRVGSLQNMLQLRDLLVPLGSRLSLSCHGLSVSCERWLSNVLAAVVRS